MSIVTDWMIERITAVGELFQVDAADYILRAFGGDHVYENKNGNLAIDKTVLREFNKITKDTVVWVRAGRYWRLRQPSDDPRRQQP